jgi:hypothetical protein
VSITKDDQLVTPTVDGIALQMNDRRTIHVPNSIFGIAENAGHVRRDPYTSITFGHS